MNTMLTSGRRALFFRPLLILLFGVFVATSGYGESVLVAVQDITDIQEADDEYAAASRFHLTALEDGIMEVLFDGGHIVFNLGNYEHSTESRTQQRYTVRKVAEEGGAAFVVQLAVAFERTAEERLRPSSVDYELWEVNSGSAVLSGERSAPFGFSDELEDRGSRSATLGRRIAEELLNAW